MKILHIINPVVVGEHSDLHTAQPITFESMRIAKAVSETLDTDLEVKLAATYFAEDMDIVPDYFIKCNLLTRSVLDYGTFSKEKKLPFLNDILMNAYNCDSNVDFIVFSNVDIAVMPSFYAFVSRKIREGFDSMIINRRTIPKSYTNVNELQLMYAELGESHQGYDCFVMRRSLIPSFKLERIIVGARRVGRSLYLNLQSFSVRFIELDNVHMTFHIGNDKVWRKGAYNDYFEFNQQQYSNICSLLKELNKPVDDYQNSAFQSVKKRRPSRIKRFIKKCFNLQKIK